MSTSRTPDDPSNKMRIAGTSLGLSIAIIAVIVLILAAGAAVMFSGSDDGDQAAAIPTPSGTSELVVLGGTPTPDRATADTLQSTPSPTTGQGATSTPSATVALEDPTSTDEPLDEPTETPPPDPTETLEPEPTEDDPDATALPIEGDFGFLPPAQLPSGGVSSRLDLEYQLGMSLEALPVSGNVFLLDWPLYSYEDVEAARDNLGLQGEIVEQGVNVFRVESDRGTLFVSPTEVDFRAAGFSEGSDLPDDPTAIAIAREWVELSGFTTGEMDSGEVVGRDEDLERVVVKLRPVAPQPNLAPNPAATVNIGPGGTVLEVRISWPSEFIPSAYGYSDPLDIWQAVQSGQGFLEADVSGVFATGQLTGVATIADYSTAYTLAGNAATEQFLTPLLRFEGTARIDQTGDVIPVFVSIPVVYLQEGTAG